MNSTRKKSYVRAWIFVAGATACLLLFQNFRELETPDEAHKLAPPKPVQDEVHKGFYPSGREGSPEELGRAFLDHYTGGLLEKAQARMDRELGLSVESNEPAERGPAAVPQGPARSGDERVATSPQLVRWNVSQPATLRLRLGEHGSVRCVLRDQGAQVRYSQRLSETSEMVLQHDSGLAQNSTVGLSIRW